MDVVILCGGQGARMREETEYRPKPMVDVGGRPLLWHIMRGFGHQGLDRFVLCLGYKGGLIKDYFLDYEAHTRDCTMRIGSAGREVPFWKAGETLELNGDESAFPQPLSQAAKGDYVVMALLERGAASMEAEVEVVAAAGLDGVSARATEDDVSAVAALEHVFIRTQRTVGFADAAHTGFTHRDTRTNLLGNITRWSCNRPAEHRKAQRALLGAIFDAAIAAYDARCKRGHRDTKIPLSRNKTDPLLRSRHRRNQCQPTCNE